MKQLDRKRDVKYEIFSYLEFTYRMINSMEPHTDISRHNSINNLINSPENPSTFYSNFIANFLQKLKFFDILLIKKLKRLVRKNIIMKIKVRNIDTRVKPVSKPAYFTY